MPRRVEIGGLGIPISSFLWFCARLGLADESGVVLPGSLGHRGGGLQSCTLAVQVPGEGEASAALCSHSSGLSQLSVCSSQSPVRTSRVAGLGEPRRMSLSGRTVPRRASLGTGAAACSPHLGRWCKQGLCCALPCVFSCEARADLHGRRRHISATATAG